MMKHEQTKYRKQKVIILKTFVFSKYQNRTLKKAVIATVAFKGFSELKVVIYASNFLSILEICT